MSAERFGGLRARVAAEAARLMYEEGVKQYFTAKRMAARRLLGKTAGNATRYRPADLPSNGEIRDALLALAQLAEGSRRTRRLFAMRVLALGALRDLAPLSPRLIGSVSTGHIRRGSDIDIQVFADHEESVERHLRALGWAFEPERVTIQKAGEVREYLHFHVADTFPIELTLYPPLDLRLRPRSSTDGKPIVRVTAAALEALLARDHPEPWARHLGGGPIEGLDEALAERDHDLAADAESWALEPPPGPFDGLLLDGPDEDTLAGAALSPGDDDDESGTYDPLPGFEHYT